MPQLQDTINVAFRLAKPINGKLGGAGLSKTPDGRFLLMQLDAVIEPDTKAMDPAIRVNAAKTISQIRGDQQSLEYVKSLRKSFVVKVAKDRL